MKKAGTKLQLHIYLDLGKDRTTGEENVATAVISNVYNGVWRHFLGNLGYYQYLQDILDDLSKSNRSQDISFYKYAFEDPCATWIVGKAIGDGDIKDCLVDGQERVNNVRKEYYLNKFGIINNIMIDEQHPIQGGKSKSCTLTMEARFLGIGELPKTSTTGISGLIRAFTYAY